MSKALGRIKTLRCQWSQGPRFKPIIMKTKPTHEVRLGSIKAAVWKNNTETGARYNATFSRLYKDGGKWESTDSFGRDDLLLLAKVADVAHSWICEQPHEVQAQPAPGHGQRKES